MTPIVSSKGRQTWSWSSVATPPVWPHVRQEVVLAVTRDNGGVDLAELRSLLKSEDPRASLALETILGFEQQDWVTIFHDDNSDAGGDLRIACFLKPEAVEDALRDSSFDLDNGGGRPGFVGYSNGEGGWNVEYLTVGSEEVVPLVFHRYFSGPFPNIVELAEDFRLVWDLYEDRATGRFLTTDELGDIITVAEFRDGDLRVNKRYLRRYQAARQLALSLQVVVDRRGGDEISHLTSINVDVAEGQVRLAYHGGDGLYDDDRPNFTRLLGKRIILPPPIERCDLWPYEPTKQYETFIIGTDAEGDPIMHTCDPDTLANYFEKNEDAPHYLTPVFFERRVFDKYYADSDRYEVSDGYLRASGAWGLRMDDALDNHVAVFLGDLGSDIPYREQQYWRSFNVAPPGSMSETAIRRSFLGQFYDSDRIEHRFVASYNRVLRAWQACYGWPLYKPPHEGDAHIEHSIHVPTNAGFGQFDDQIVRLAKLVVDSLNEEEMSTALVNPIKEEKGIAKLERILGQLGIASDPLCADLRRVQGVRTRSAAHRKGGDFELTTLLAGAADLPSLFTDLLERLIQDFDALSGALTA